MPRQEPEAEVAVGHHHPGSKQVRYTIERDGFMMPSRMSGATIFTNACGPCIGQWAREPADKNREELHRHSFNRNFAKRADGNPNTHAFVASPEMVTAMAIAASSPSIPCTTP
jgi:aconitate hydratase